MAKGFIHISTSQNGNVAYYAREKECSFLLSSSNLSFEKEALLNDWLRLENQEKMGDKFLGIRGRHDAQVRKNYILSLPNELTPKEGAERIKTIVDKTPIAFCSYSIFVHKGEKNGIVNQHAHLIVNERNLTTRKKDREMIKKEFLEKTFRPLFETEFAVERKQGKDLLYRDRIDEQFFHADLSYSQQQIQQLTHQEASLTMAEETPSQQVNDTADWDKLLLDYAVLAEQKRVEEQQRLVEEHSLKEVKESKEHIHRHRGLSF